MLADERPLQLQAVGLAASLALVFDLLFFFVDELPATVPVAMALAVLEITVDDPLGQPLRALPRPAALAILAALLPEGADRGPEHDQHRDHVGNPEVPVPQMCKGDRSAHRPLSVAASALWEERAGWRCSR
jgi:hypothetical protein